MAGLQQYASKDSVLVFDGRNLHKNAFAKKGLPTDAHASLLCGKLDGEVPSSDLKPIIERMIRVKNGFASRVKQIVGVQWVNKAKAVGMCSRTTGLPFDEVNDIIEELGSHATMENFQTWYAICYKDSDAGAAAKKEAEAGLMKELDVQYHDNTMVNGCVGPLRVDAMSVLMEKLQAKSKLNQGFHVVKSNPGKENEIKGKSRRRNGDYYIIQSDSNGKMVNNYLHNVRLMLLVLNLLTVSSRFTLTFRSVKQVPRYSKQWNASRRIVQQTILFRRDKADGDRNFGSKHYGIFRVVPKRASS